MSILDKNYTVQFINENTPPIDKVEKQYRMLVECQEVIKKTYDEINYENYDDIINHLKGLIKTEELWLQQLIEYMNQLFNINIQAKWYNAWKRFTVQIEFDRYEIKPPYGLDKHSREYLSLKKLLIRLHEEYFLCNGGIGYAFTTTEYHMWEIPNFADKIKNEIKRG